ncbi:N-acetylglucosamine-6-phosphate deacetylase [Paenibacillus algicola]|uniref:N-acetylglucosamine-6-phosphate deacetylase n=1 Tax=Paenibacillus algicola TaxID=2565926 RepID=A0A4V1G3P5_9BACL|nr:N-acetylglucosamine-6-phosphate deacetylase [Paenibacillus algicola]QCT01914.1 N-acetylglucosamine-6-phosphate deacetylase [Paenibacillus algicola]
MSRSPQSTLLYGSVITPGGLIPDGAVAMQGEQIVYAGPASGLPSVLEQEAEQVIRRKEGYIMPGFVDIHVHGGSGEDFMEADIEGLNAITSFHCSQGTTSMLATTMTAPKHAIDAVLQNVQQYRSSTMPYARLEGVHLEGPFISPQWPGAQNPEHIVPASILWLEEWEQSFPGLVKLMTLAPERDGALEAISWLKEHGIVAALGHTDATYEQVQRAVDAGLSHGVHTFNAMTGLHHRKPGTAGALLGDDRLSAEIIADGIHVHPAAVSILARLKPADGLILVTDAVSAAGMPDGEYMLGGLQTIVEKGIATLKSNSNSLAGSTLTMIRGFQYLVKEVGLSIQQASAAASFNPAKVIGIDDRTGSLAKGLLADVLLLNDQLDLEAVWVQGSRKY